MKRLYYIRHGLSEGNQTNRWSGGFDTPLVDEGHEQARKTGKVAKDQGLSFDLIVSSPLQRAHDTAKHVAKEVGYPIENIILSDLVKERSFGELEGKQNFDARKIYLEEGEDKLENYYDIESYLDLHARASQALEYLHGLPHDTVLVVSHGAMGRALTRTAKGLPPHTKLDKYNNAELVQLI